MYPIQYLFALLLLLLLLLFLPPVPLDALGQRHAAAAEAVQRAADRQVDPAAAQLPDAVQVGQAPAAARVRHGDAAPPRQPLHQRLVDAPLQALVVGRVDQKLGTERLEALDGFCIFFLGGEDIGEAAGGRVELRLVGFFFDGFL